MAARIFRPAPNAMQSGKGNSRQWLLEFEPSTPREIEPLMGYTASGDTKTQVKLTFETLEEAEAYCQREGIAYSVQPPQDQKVHRNVYSDNFRADRKTPWTH